MQSIFVGLNLFPDLYSLMVDFSLLENVSISLSVPLFIPNISLYFFVVPLWVNNNHEFLLDQSNFLIEIFN